MKLLRILAPVLIGLMAAPTIAELDLNTPEGVVAVQRKIHCSTVDGEEKTYVWQGHGYARRPGQPDKRIFGLLGMNVRQCVSVTNDKGEVGYRLISREVMLYLDPDTGEVLRTWDNPYTGETVDVIHVANDPVNGRPNFGYGRDGKVAQLPIKMVGDYWQMNLEIPLFYHNILGGNYQKYVGGSYHATELFNYYGMADSLLDDQLTSINPGISWVRIAQWLPWMEMGGRDGITYFNAQGTKLKSWDDLPDLLKSEIAANYPKYRHAPPGDDQRPNETSWTFFKKELDRRAIKEDGTAKKHQGH